ncbi:MAG: hypothetical protein P1Q69_12785 [Candidatus Thorarchaeota archaeon]|nr:hypothetical protein [Candidatus Thorarchaeota archaeon]
MNYTDVDRDLGIEGATIGNESIDVYGLIPVGNGIYTLWINVSSLAKGSHSFNLTADAPGYDPRYINFTVVIREAYTQIVPTEGSLNIPVGNDPVFYVRYWDFDNDVPVTNETPFMVVTTWTHSVVVTYVPGEQRYRVVFITEDTDTIEPNIPVTFTFSKGANYQIGVFNISVTIRTHNTEFTLVSAVEPTTSTGIINISVYYRDTDNFAGIAPIGSIGISVTNDSGAVFATLVDGALGDGHYIVRISADQFGLGVQTFNVTLSWTGAGDKYYTKWIIAPANVIGVDSRMTLLLSSDSTEYLEIMSYTFIFAELGGSGITNTTNPYGDGNVHISVSFQGFSVNLSKVLITEINYLTQPGNYSISFNNSILGATGVVYMNVYINWTAGVLPYYTNRFDVISVKVLPRDTLVSITPPSPTFRGEDASFTFTYDDVTGGGTSPIANSSSLSISLSLSSYSVTYNTTTKEFTVTFVTDQNPLNLAPLGTKSFTLDVIWVGEPFYSNRTGRTVFIRIISRQTVLDYQSPAPTQYLDNVTFTITWTDVAGESVFGIPGASVLLFDGATLVNPTKYTVVDDGYGNYTITLNTTYKTTPGIYSLRVDLSITDYYIPDISATRQFNIRYRVTLLSSEPTDKLPYNSSLVFIVAFQDLYTLTAINNDTFRVTLQILNGSDWYFTIEWKPAFQYYILTIHTYNHPELVVNVRYSLHIEATYDAISPFYGSDDAYILFELRTRSSALDFEDTPDTTPYLENASFQIFYRDVDSSYGIIAESITVNKGVTPLILNSEYWVIDDGNGYYTIVVNSVALDGLGLTEITIYATWNPSTSPYHNDAETSLEIRVSQREANVEITSPPSQTNFGNNVTFTFAYIDILSGSAITTITQSNIQVWAEGSQLTSGQFVLSGSSGVYTLQVDSTILSSVLVMNFNLTILVDWADGIAPYYSDDAILVRVTTVGRTLTYSPQPVQSANFGDNLTIAFQLFDTENSTLVSGAIVYFDCQTVSLIQGIDFWLDESNGLYTIEIDTLSLLSPGILFFDLNISWNALDEPYYVNLTTITTSASIRPISTTLTASSQSASAEWLQEATVRVDYFNELYSNLTSGAQVQWFWQDVGQSGNFTEIGSSGVYVASIDTGLASSTGTTIITITAKLANYEDAVTFITLIIETLPSDLSITAPEEAIAGIIFIPRGSGINITIYLEDVNNVLPIDNTYVLRVNASIEGTDFFFVYNGTPGYYECMIPSGGSTILEIGSTYNVRLTAALQNYNPASGIFKISLLQTQSQLDLSSGTTEDVIKIYSELVNFTVHLYAPDLLEDIDDAVVTWVLSEKGLYGNLTWLGSGGLYYVTFNTSEVGFGIWGISFRATPNDPIYSNSATRLSLTINRIPTDVIREFSEITREWGWTGNVSFIFNTTLFGPVAGASAEYSWSGGSGNATDIGYGIYIIPIASSLVDPGSYSLTITFSKENYQEGPTGLRIIINPVETDLSVNSIDYHPDYFGNIENMEQLQIPLGDSVTLYFWFNDTNSEDGYVGGLPGGVTTLNSYLRGPSIDGYLNVSLNDEGGGLYSFTFDTMDPTIGSIIDSESYRLYFEVFLTNRNTADILIRIHVIEIPTELILRNSDTTISFENGMNPILEFYFNDTWHNQGVTGADFNAAGAESIVQIITDESGEGVYTLELETGALLSTGGGVIVVNFNATNYGTKQMQLIVNIQPNNVDTMVLNLTRYGLPVALVIIMLLVGYVRVWSVPKRLRQINGQIKALRKGKIPKPLPDAKSRQALVANLFNDTYSELGITRSPSQMPEEAIAVDIPEMGELLVQLSILTHLSPEELDEFKADIAKMKLSEQAAFVREVIEQEAIRAARRDGKTMEQIISEIEQEASQRIAGEEITKAEDIDLELIGDKVPTPRPTLDIMEEPEPPEPTKTETVLDSEEQLLSLFEIDELRADLVRRGIPEHEINTLIEQAKTLPRDLVEELIRSLEKGDSM